jgi:hypothetical protein
MRNTGRVAHGGLLVTALGFGMNVAIAQDLAKVAPNDVKVLIDNDRVRVMEVLHKPGAKEPMHTHPAYVAVYLNGTRVRVTTPDGKPRSAPRPPVRAHSSAQPPPAEAHRAPRQPGAGA